MPIEFSAFKSRRSARQADALLRLDAAPAKSVAELARAIEVQASSMSRSLAALEAQKLVERRGRGWIITDAGREEAHRLAAEMREPLQRIREAMSHTLSAVALSPLAEQFVGASARVHAAMTEALATPFPTSDMALMAASLQQAHALHFSGIADATLHSPAMSAAALSGLAEQATQVSSAALSQLLKPFVGASVIGTGLQEEYAAHFPAVADAVLHNSAIGETVSAQLAGLGIASAAGLQLSAVADAVSAEAAGLSIAATAAGLAEKFAIGGLFDELAQSAPASSLIRESLPFPSRETDQLRGYALETAYTDRFAAIPYQTARHTEQAWYCSSCAAFLGKIRHALPCRCDISLQCPSCGAWVAHPAA
jgi:DNA-binding MarR family transcriptional regulator